MGCLWFELRICSAAGTRKQAREDAAMILFWRDDRRRLYQALDWSLYTTMGERIYLVSEEALFSFLRSRPDTEFHLRNYRLREDMDPHREIDDPKAADYGAESGHIFCGAVRYDSTSGRVITRSG
jgi:hypothetical protein